MMDPLCMISSRTVERRAGDCLQRYIVYEVDAPDGGGDQGPSRASPYKSGQGLERSGVDHGDVLYLHEGLRFAHSPHGFYQPGSLALAWRESRVAAAQGETVFLAHRGAGHDLNVEEEVAHHLLDHL